MKTVKQQKIPYVKIDLIITSDDERGNIFFFEHRIGEDSVRDEQGNTLLLQDGMPLVGFGIEYIPVEFAFPPGEIPDHIKEDYIEERVEMMGYAERNRHYIPWYKSNKNQRWFFRIRKRKI